MARPRTDAGFTLIEMLVVIGLIALLMTMGVAVIQSMSERRTLDSAAFRLGVLVRQTRNEALESRANGDLRVAPDGRSVTVLQWARALDLDFEREDAGRVRGALLDPQAGDMLGGASLTEEGLGAGGGRALAMESEGAVVDLGRAPIFSPTRGIQVTCRIWPSAFDNPRRWYPGVIAAKGSAWELRLTERGHLLARVNGPPGSGGVMIESVEDGRVTGRAPLDVRPTLHGWTEVGFRFAEGELSLLVDGAVIARATADLQYRRSVTQGDGRWLDPAEREPLTIGSRTSDADSFYGLVDDLRIWTAMGDEPELVLGDGMEVRPADAHLRFAPSGRLDPAFHRFPVTMTVVEEGSGDFRRVRVSLQGRVEVRAPRPGETLEPAGAAPPDQGNEQ